MIKSKAFISHRAAGGLRELVDLFKSKLAAQKEIVMQLESVASAKDGIIAAMQRQIDNLDGLASTLQEEAKLEAVQRQADADLARAQRQLGKASKRCKKLGADPSNA